MGVGNGGRRRDGEAEPERRGRVGVARSLEPALQAGLREAAFAVDKRVTLRGRSGSKTRFYHLLIMVLLKRGVSSPS